MDKYKPNWVAVGIEQQRLNTLDHTQVTRIRPQYALMATRWQHIRVALCNPMNQKRERETNE